jgi:hypothetical protein
MPKSVNFGGQRRTAQLTCGFIIKGHPTEVDKKTKLHWRYCDECDMKDKDKTIPEYSAVNAGINGWGGLNGGNTIGLSQQRASTVLVGLGTDAVQSTNIIAHFEDGAVKTEVANGEMALTDEALLALFALGKDVLPKSKKTEKKKK